MKAYAMLPIEQLT